MRKILGIALLLMPMVAVAQNAFNGTWKVDNSKWQLDPKPIVLELKDGMFNCTSCAPQLSLKADGTDQKVTGNPGVDTGSLTIVDPNTTRLVLKKDGKVTMNSTATVSADGKTLKREVEQFAPDGTRTSYTTELARTGDPEQGAHMISGSWVAEKTESADPMTLTFASSGDGLMFKGSDGEAYNIKFDGKDYPFKGDAGTATVSVKKIDANTIEETYKSKDGQVSYVSRLTVSPDGKTLTQVGEDKRAGRTATFVADKQGNEEAEK